VVYHRDHLGTGSIQAFVRTVDKTEEDQLRGSLSKRLPTYMMPRRIHFMDMLPKNQSGKIDRQQLKALCT